MLKRKQQGAALILLVIAIVLTAVTFVVTNLSVNKSRETRHTNTANALAQAKEALISYAATFHDTNAGGGAARAGLMGFLPCPEILTSDPEGTSINSCEGEYISAIGRVPWKELGVPPLKDGSGSCLWYAVSSEYKNGGKGVLDPAALGLALGPGYSRSEMLNDDSNGSFTLSDQNGNIIRGNTPEDRVVAIIIAPGAQLSGQNRANPVANTQCGDDFNTANFLETFNGVDNRSITTGTRHSIDGFITSGRVSNNALNDQIITISQREIFDEIKRRSNFTQIMSNTTQALAECIAAYGKASDTAYASGTAFRLPWPAAMDLNGGYAATLYYRDSQAYVEDPNIAPPIRGRFPVDVSASNTRTKNGFDQYLLEDTACSNLTLPAGSVDLTTNVTPNTNSVERRIWQNWKDHFFYVVGSGFAADDLVSATANCPSINCITVDGKPFAAAVFFSGSRINNQIRTVPPNDPDTKSILSNYLEADNINLDNIYETNMTNSNVNDIAFCISDDMTVSDCQ